uniref:Glycosyl transferase family 2 n=1 Tax=Pithovirus LCPAC404 TaxID=2506597 RepID=A0A481ZC34_9VIRU|nr:MAG: glycosyl transferase family 2 [Pithovirus LCPAC404]
MYYFAVGAVFKDESHILHEWIKHYLFHGVEHIYLINDQSTDNYMEILKPYIDNDTVTLFQCNEPCYLGRQRVIYGKFLLPILGNVKWLAVLDLDEFLWSPRDIDLKGVLKNFEGTGQIQFSQSIFGSNDHIEQPKGIVQSFTKRGENIRGCYKYIVNSDYKFTSLNVHHALFLNKKYQKGVPHFMLLDFIADKDNPCFVLNHYNCQSLNFWKEVKTLRGSCDNFKVRNMDLFREYDQNDIEDFGLYEQNKPLF